MIAKHTLPTLAAALSCSAIMAGMTCAPGVAQTAGRQAEAGGRPNILVIMSDQHSRSFLGCYGNRIVRTPDLDRLAAGGMRFSAACCAAPVCVPSRMSFLTSRTPSANRVRHNDCVPQRNISSIKCEATSPE